MILVQFSSQKCIRYHCDWCDGFGEYEIYSEEYGPEPCLCSSCSGAGFIPRENQDGGWDGWDFGEKWEIQIQKKQ